MKKNLLFGLLSIFAVSSVNSQVITVAAARATPLGSTVTVKGIVTNGSELGVIRYFQDNTAGLAAYSGTTSPANFTVALRGDSVTITGVTKEYKNLLELDPVLGFTVHASGKPSPIPTVITPVAFDETKESTLIKFLGCTFSATGNFAGNTNYTVTSAGQTFLMRVVSSATSIVGTPIPTGSVNITGLASQFCNTPSVSCTTGYQLLVRDLNDFSSVLSGVTENSTKSNLTVYPNPVNSKIHFMVGANEVITLTTVTDITGRVVYSSKENTASADLSFLAEGIYNIFVSTDKQNYQAKFTINK